jgi:hypothetical protein
MRLLAVKVPGQKGPVSKKPLFKIQAIVRCSQAARLLFSRISCGFPSLRVHVPVFSPPDVTSSPALNEIRKFVGKMVGNLVASPKQFVRWYVRRMPF